MIQRLFFLLFIMASCLALPSSSYGQLHSNDGPLRDETFKPQILEIPFNETLATVNAICTGMGLKQTDERSDASGSLKEFTYAGIPIGLSLSQGETTLSFFRNRLYRMELSFDPLYTNYLLLKNQLSEELGERFYIKESREMIDPFLKTELSFLQPDEYNDSIDEKIAQSILNSKTMFSLSLEDSKREFDVVCSYFPISDKELRLTLIYHLIKFNTTIQKYVEDQSPQMLPE